MMATRIYISNLKCMLEEMDMPHAEKVHFLFMNNYIDDDNYDFRDEWMIDGYVECYNDFFQTGEGLNALNRYVIDIMQEWKEDSYYRYKKAKSDLLYWIQSPIPAFTPSLGKEIESAYEATINSDIDVAMFNALLPYPAMIHEQIKNKNYEQAAANIYCLFEHLVNASKVHEKWFESYHRGGQLSNIVCLTEILVDLYCHLRQIPDLPSELKVEMNIHMSIYNTKTHFFGDPESDSRAFDMYHDANKQVSDYSEIEDGEMWQWYKDKLKSDNHPAKL